LESAVTTTQNDSTPARRAEQVLGRIGDLPAAPDASARILASPDGEGFESRDAIALIEADASLAKRALALAKLLCATSGKAREGQDLNSLDDVALLAGFSTLRASVVACQIFDAFADRARVAIEADTGDGSKGAALDRRAFWMSSVAVASASESLAAARGIDPADAFLAGLAQGLGVVALDSILPSSFARVAAFAEREGKDLAEIERAIMGIDHHTVGRKVAERWQFPQCVRDAIWLAGVAPERVPDTPTKNIVTTVNLALASVRFAQLAWFGDAPVRDSVANLAGRCSISPDVVARVERSLFDVIATRADALGVPGASTGELADFSLRRARAELERQRAREAPRERLVERQKAALAAVSAFQANLAPGARVDDVASAIIESATTALSAGFVGILIQGSEGGGARVFTSDAPTIKTATVQPPSNAAPLRESFASERTPVPLAAKAPWIAAHPSLAETGVKVVACVLPTGGQDFAALLLDKEPADAASMRPLLGAWGSALAVVSANDAANHARTRLADADRKAEEARVALLEADGLRSIASLATGAMDSFMAQVEMIRSRCEMLAPGLDKQRDQRWLEAIAHAGSNVGTLVQTLRLFSETPEVRRAATPLNWLLERSGREARGRYKHDPRRYPQPRPRIIAEEGLPNVLVDAEQVIDALAEVILNGLESEKSEVVEIRAHIDHNTERALIIVRDDGEGMPADDIPKAFDPYFTTKRKLRRLGLGLTRAKRLIELSAGEISLRADPGGGLAVAMFVPLAPPGMEAAAIPDSELESEPLDADAEA
jgi:signal transduction histidine kinase/HD-like signal output (HDOD) protein